MQIIILCALTLGLLISNPTKLWSNDLDEDLDEAERVYFDHRVNFFDMSLITNVYLCSIAIKNDIPKWETADIYKTYIREALFRGFDQKKCAQLTGRHVNIKD